MKSDGVNGYTLDIDATGVEVEKQAARWTYKNFKGYMPMVEHLGENGLVIRDEFREGNVPPSKRNLAFLKHCVKQLPKGKKVKALRSDSAGYQADIVNYCEANDMEFGIGADLDEAILVTIKDIAKEEWRPYKDG